MSWKIKNDNGATCEIVSAGRVVAIVNTGNSLADARLIVAARDLLDALEGVTWELEVADKRATRADKMGLRTTPPRVARAIKKARDTIARVKGGAE